MEQPERKFVVNSEGETEIVSSTKNETGPEIKPEEKKEETPPLDKTVEKSVITDAQTIVAEQAKKDDEKIRKVREELGLPQQKNQENPANQVAEKIKTEYLKELGKSITRVAIEVQEFEDSLKRNKFNRISFHADDLRSAVRDETIDFPKAAQAINDFYSSLRRNFMPEDPREKLSLEPHNFTRVIDSLDRIKGVFISLRSTIDKKPNLENELKTKTALLSEDLTKIFVVLNRKMDDINDAKLALLRYTNR